MRAVLLALLLLAGSALGQSPLDRAAGTAAGAITPRVNAAVDKVAPVPRALPPAKNPQCRMLAAKLIVRWEVTSPSYYERRLVRPIWPKGASGVTWGIGYDGGHQRRSVIEDDWSDHEHVVRLADTAGITGPRAGEALPRFRDIATPFPHAYRIFADRSLVEYERRAERADRRRRRSRPCQLSSRGSPRARRRLRGGCGVRCRVPSSCPQDSDKRDASSVSGCGLPLTFT